MDAYTRCLLNACGYNSLPTNCLLTHSGWYLELGRNTDFKYLYPQEPAALGFLLYSPLVPDRCWELDVACLSFQLTSYRTARTHLRSRMDSWSTQIIAWASRSPLSATRATSCWAILCLPASMALTETGTILSHDVTVGSSSPLGTAELLVGNTVQELFYENALVQSAEDFLSHWHSL